MSSRTRPDVEEKLIAEIDQITGGDPDYDLQYDDLMALTYTTQVIKETLRIYPPMPVTIRRSLKEGTLGRYRIRKGDIILVGALAAQRDPRYWGPDANRFDPEQFSMERVVARPRHAFIPFSIGRRQCMAQEVTFMMLRVVLFEIYKHYRLRLEPGARVMKNTVVTTKPKEVRIIRLRRPSNGNRRALVPLSDPADPVTPFLQTQWGQPTEIPEESAYHNLVIAYGSNFGANKELAERFAERSHFYGYTGDAITLNELAESPPQTQPWLLVVLTSTYTSNPPANASTFKSWIERTPAGTERWRHCRYLVWGLGNSQWNAFLAFPRYVHARLAELGATPLAEFAYGDVGSPAWEHQHADWNDRVWPVLLELSGARATKAAAVRTSAENIAAGALTNADSNITMARSLRAEASPGALLVPTILTNVDGIDTVKAHAIVCRELQAGKSAKRTRHLEITLPPGITYKAGAHLGVCPKNDEERVERLARHLGAVLDGVFVVPKNMSVHTVPKGVTLQVRNVLTNLIDITSRPTLPLLDLLLEKVTDPAERTKLVEIKDVLETPDGPDSPLRTAIDAGGYDALRLLDEFSSCSVNIFEFLRAAPPLRPRYYSTSSSPRVHGDGVAHVAVGLEVTSVPGMPDRDFRGMSSHYVHTLREGDCLNVFLDAANGFHLQVDVAKPMIFVSAGTGFAPMRAFLWERLAMKHAGVQLAEAALFNGIRSSSLDYIYRDEIEQFTREGVLDHFHLAVSRERPGHRTYVQDRIRDQGATVWRLLAAGGYVYVCGSPAVRDAVRLAFVDVVAKHGSLPPEHAEAHLHELEMTSRYRPDLWG